MPPAVGRGLDGVRRLLEMVNASVVGRYWARLREIEFADRSVALAAKGFVSLFPFLLVIVAVSPVGVRTGLLEVLGTRFGVSGDAGRLVVSAVNSADAIRSSTGVLGVLLTFLFAASFTTSLQRVYLRSWRRPHAGTLRDRPRGLGWLAGFVAFLLVLGVVGRLISGPPGTVIALVLGLVGSTLGWWWTAHALLRGHVRWRALLPTALVSGLGGSLYSTAASLWMPYVLESNVSKFGTFGVSLAFVTWFTGFAFLLVGGAALAPCLAEGDDALGRWLRGPTGGVLAAYAPASLPAPGAAP
jgi:membrane protein